MRSSVLGWILGSGPNGFCGVGLGSGLQGLAIDDLGCRVRGGVLEGAKGPEPYTVQ